MASFERCAHAYGRIAFIAPSSHFRAWCPPQTWLTLRPAADRLLPEPPATEPPDPDRSAVSPRLNRPTQQRTQRSACGGFRQCGKSPRGWSPHHATDIVANVTKASFEFSPAIAPASRVRAREISGPRMPDVHGSMIGRANRASLAIAPDRTRNSARWGIRRSNGPAACRTLDDRAANPPRATIVIEVNCEARSRLGSAKDAKSAKGQGDRGTPSPPARFVPWHLFSFFCVPCILCGPCVALPHARQPVRLGSAHQARPKVRAGKRAGPGFPGPACCKTTLASPT
jgi:hypothetical protein